MISLSHCLMRLSNILNETAINLEFELNDHSNQRLEPHRYPPALLLHQHLPHHHSKTNECNHCNKNSNSREILEQQPNQPELHLKLKHLDFDLKVCLSFPFSSFNISLGLIVVVIA